RGDGASTHVPREHRAFLRDSLGRGLAQCSQPAIKGMTDPSCPPPHSDPGDDAGHERAEGNDRKLPAADRGSQKPGITAQEYVVKEEQRGRQKGAQEGIDRLTKEESAEGAKPAGSPAATSLETETAPNSTSLLGRRGGDRRGIVAVLLLYQHRI